MEEFVGSPIGCFLSRADVCGVGSKFPRGKTGRKRNKKGFCDIFAPSFEHPTPQTSGLYFYYIVGLFRNYY